MKQPAEALAVEAAVKFAEMVLEAVRELQADLDRCCTCTGQREEHVDSAGPSPGLEKHYLVADKWMDTPFRVYLSATKVIDGLDTGGTAAVFIQVVRGVLDHLIPGNASYATCVCKGQPRVTCRQAALIFTPRYRSCLGMYSIEHELHDKEHRSMTESAARRAWSGPCFTSALLCASS